MACTLSQLLLALIACVLKINLELCLPQGYLLRNTPNVYLTALAMAALPNTVGYIVGPVLTAVGVFLASRTRQGSGAPDEGDAWARQDVR